MGGTLAGPTRAQVGDESDVRDWRGPGTEVVALQGAHLVPGLVDAHSHPVWGLEMATGTDLSAVRDLAGLRAGRPIERALIEEALGEAPAFLRLYDGHSALASGTALSAAGVTGPRPLAQRSESSATPPAAPPGISSSTRRWTWCPG